MKYIHKITFFSFLYSLQVLISSFKVLSHIYFNDPKVKLPLPEVIGICKYFILYGLVNQGQKPEKIMPAQQTIAAVPVRLNVKGGKV